MAEELIQATKRSPEKHSFAFMFSSLPDPSDEVVDGNNPDTTLDGNI